MKNKSSKSLLKSSYLSVSTQIFAQDAINRTSDKLLSEERQNFLKLLKSESGYAEFLEIIDMTASKKLLGMPGFFKRYIYISDLFEGNAVDTKQNASFPTDHLLLDMFTGVSYCRKVASKKADEFLIYCILDLYYNHVRSCSSQKLPFITRIEREYLRRGVTELAWSGLVSMTITDNFALRALDTFFFHGYPKYLLYKGNAQSQRLIESHISKKETPNFFENIFLDDFLSDVYSTSPVTSPLVSRVRQKKVGSTVSFSV